MNIEQMFAQLCRLADYGDGISKGCKTGANMSIGKGGVILTNDVHSVGVLLENKEFGGEAAFKTHLFPDAKPPLGIAEGKGAIDFSWRERGVKKTTNIPSVGNLYEKGKELVEKKWKMEQGFMLKTEHFGILDEDIHVTRLTREKGKIIFEQTKATGEEVAKNEIPLKGGGLMKMVEGGDVETVSTIFSTVEFKKLPLLTDDSAIEMCVEPGTGCIFARVGMGAVSAKVIVAPMKYKR